MTSSTLVAILGFVYFGTLAAVFLMIPRLWRPELPFGVSVPSQGSEEVRRRALHFWTTRVILLTGSAIAATLVLARLKPETWAVNSLIFPYFALAVFFYTRARKMLLPLSQPSQKVGAALRPRRYRDYMNPWWEVIPASFIVLALGLHTWLCLTPSNSGVEGLSVSKRVIVLAGFYPLFLVMAVLMAHSKQSLGAGDPNVCLAANEVFRKVWIRYMYAFRLYLTALLVTFPACVALGQRGLIRTMPALSFVRTALVGGMVLFFAGSWIIGLRYGQGGWRWAIRKGLVEKSEARAIFDGDGMEDNRWKLGMFYFNPRDPSILVEDRFGMGWTANVGNIWALALMAAILGLCVLPPLLERLFQN